MTNYNETVHTYLVPLIEKVDFSECNDVAQIKSILSKLFTFAKRQQTNNEDPNSNENLSKLKNISPAIIKDSIEIVKTEPKDTKPVKTEKTEKTEQTEKTEKTEEKPEKTKKTKEAKEAEKTAKAEKAKKAKEAKEAKEAKKAKEAEKAKETDEPTHTDDEIQEEKPKKTKKIKTIVTPGKKQTTTTITEPVNSEPDSEPEMNTDEIPVSDFEEAVSDDE